VVETAASDVARRLAVCDVLVRYAQGVDRRDWDLVASCFTPDAYIAGSRYSASFEEYFPILRASVDAFGVTMHFMGNQLYDAGDGADNASVQTYAVAYHYGNVDPNVQNLVVGVRYQDSMVHTDGEWRIRHRAVTADWTREGETILPVATPAGS
jgi:hypothetical protein